MFYWLFWVGWLGSGFGFICLGYLLICLEFFVVWIDYFGFMSDVGLVVFVCGLLVETSWWFGGSYLL